MGVRKFGRPLASIAASVSTPRRRRLVLTVVVALVAAAIGWSYVSRPAPVTTANATRGTAAEIVYGTGAVEPLRWARVATLIKGRIVERCRCEGKSVETGALLARLDDKEAQATLRELRAREDFDRREVERQRKLAARNITTTQLLERAEADLLRTQALIAAQVERIDQHRLVSPMDGVVLREDGEVGEVVDSNTVLFLIGLPKPLQLVAEVNEEDIPRVQVGQTVLLRFDAFTDQRLTGFVREITPAGDPVAKTYRIRVSLPDDTPLMIGMSVEANVIVREKQDALLVPTAAVLQDHIFVVENDRAVRRKVEIGIRGTRQVEILSGLEGGERVISPALPDLRDGARISSSAESPGP